MTLFAAPPGQKFPVDQFLINAGWLALVLLVGAVLLQVAITWRKRHFNRGVESISLMAEYREMFESGEISEEEYRAIRGRMAGPLKAGGKPGGAGPGAGPPQPQKPGGAGATGANPAGPDAGGLDLPSLP